MSGNVNIESRLANLLKRYGNGEDETAPTGKQWEALLSFPSNIPVTLINYFKLRERAQYPAGHGEGMNVSGVEAFTRYAGLAAPYVEKSGGKFLFMGPVIGSFIGQDTDWSVAVVGAYPSPEAALSLFEEPGYIECYIHRKAACERQYIMIATEQQP
ncbi:MAG: DUF1330 domain-containing protein [Methyloligellaceae bacterium]